VVAVVEKKETSNGLANVVADSPTDIALAFRLGCELFEYFIAVELIWISPQTKAEARIRGFLAHSRKEMAETVDQLFETGQVNQETAMAFDNELIAFEENLVLSMNSHEANLIRNEIVALNVFLSNELTPDDFPCPGSEELEPLAAKLFSDEYAAELKSRLVLLEKSARKIVQPEAKLLTFFRLGFELLRPTVCLPFDSVFLVEPTCQTDNHEQSVSSSRRRLLDDARVYHLELAGIDPGHTTDGYDLREQICEALKFQYEEFEKFGLDLILYPNSRRLSRKGYGHVSLMGHESPWSLLRSAAATTKGAVFDKKSLEDSYKKRNLKPRKRADGVERKQDGLRGSLSRLNKKFLSKVALKFTHSDGSYRLVEVENECRKTK
jgi:hypothetical protein